MLSSEDSSSCKFRASDYLGSLCEKEGWREHIHRKKRCDLSLFQLGLRFLEHFLNEELPIPVQFHVTI